uniref:Uncharacterized protein n=1 Tax=Candidatus Kentrum sp. FM TaxID=2126340 RepID=A0A450U325_9GAMM|nr:MAG: hypothetical protein BECKFM1743C_GA0114222_109962 [Candidatus Kentron sp. FM]
MKNFSHLQSVRPSLCPTRSGLLHMAHMGMIKLRRSVKGIIVETVAGILMT